MDLTALARFHIAPGYDPSLPDTWVWEDRSADVNHNDGHGVTITGGRPDEVSEIEAGSANLQLDNAGGHYCTYNPLGRWYDRLARGCPARWGTISGAEAFSVNATSSWGAPDVGTSWSLSGTASSWNISGGYGTKSFAAANSAGYATLTGADARNGEATLVIMTTVTPTGASLLHGLQARWVDSNNYLLFSVEFTTSGTLLARIWRVVGGTLSPLASATTIVFSTNQRIKIRAQWDGPNLRLRTWLEASAEPTTWAVTTTDTQVVGSQVGLYFWRIAGNTNAGTVTMNVDDLEVLAVEIVGTVPEWPVEWDPTAIVSYAPIQIAGITRTLAQGADVLRSPIFRQLSAQPAMGYWPLEDDSAATSAASALPFGSPAALRSATAGNADCPPGAASSVTLTTAGSSSVSGTVSAWTIPQDGYAGMFYMRVPTIPATRQRMGEMTAAGTITRWILYMDGSSYSIEGYGADGTLLISPTGALFIVDPTKWVAMQLETSETGGTVNWALIWNQVGLTDFWAQSGSFSGFADRLHTGTVVAPVDNTLVSHLWLGDDLLPFNDATFIAVSAGYAGETDVARMARLGREEGTPVAVEVGTGEALGVQRQATFLDLLRSAENAGLGILYESGSSLGYRPRVGRYNDPVWMALTIGPAGDIADPAPRPTDDDQRIRNYWTVSRETGSPATASKPAHIAKSGKRPDLTTINVLDDSRLLDHASWRVHLGTYPEMRWPQIDVVLTDRPALLALWRGRPFGMRITISGIPSQGPIGASADLIVEGWSQEITSHGWRVTLTCSPARPWDVGVYDDPVRRQDSSSTTITSSYAAGVSPIVFSTVLAGDVWSTTATPYDVIISGERITVTAMAAPSGTYPFTQTATVTRAVNGIAKTLPSGSEVHMHPDQLARYAL